MESREGQVVNLNEICRACLIKTENMMHLLDGNEEVLELITKLSSVSNLEVDVNNTLPSYLCNSCEERLQISYEFQQLCQRSHEFILSCLASTSIPVKVVDIVKEVQLDDGLENVTSDFIRISNEDRVESANMSFENLNLIIKDEKFNNLSEQQNTRSENIENRDGPNEHVQEDDFLKDRSFKSYKPCEVDRKTKSKQTMRLPQYPPEEVDRIIRLTRERVYKHVNCGCCGFTAQNSRSLSVHMTRLHKKMKASWCIWCNKIFENLDEHTQTEHGDYFKCPFCGKCRTNTGHFIEHLASHSVERKYMCKICQKSFISARHLKTHHKVHANDKPHVCRLCSREFVAIHSLKIHMKSHILSKCKVCEESFRSTDAYESHKCFHKNSMAGENVTLHGAKEDAQCLENQIKAPAQNYCEECHRKVRSLQRHREKHHSGTKKGDRPALCTYCGKQFKTLAKLTVHVRSHTGETPYKCTYCSKQMTTRVQLVIHERTHTGEKPCICKICGKGFAQHSVLNTHMKLHTGRPEQCTICTKRFCRASELRQHMRRHTGEKPYVCNFCGQEFLQKSHMVEHTKTHSDDRPHKCDFCDKGFKHAGTLKAHRNIHLGKKPFECPHCSYACRQRYRLNQHMLQHEYDQPKAERHYAIKHQYFEVNEHLKDNLMAVASHQTDDILGTIHETFVE